MYSVESQGAVDVVTTLGPLNHENADQLLKTIENGLPGGQPMLVLDMHEVPLIDSAGLEALVNVQQQIQAKGGNVKLAGLTQLCHEILRITHIEEKFETYLDVKSAVGSYVR